MRHRGIDGAENRPLQFAVINPACFERQWFWFDASPNSFLNANGIAPEFRDPENRGLTVNIETAAVYPDIHRRI
jgi:hypothetical protein